MKILKNEPMSRHTTFRVGGPAADYRIPESAEELQLLIRTLAEEGKPYRILGNGSDLLVSDAGVPETVIEIRESLSGISLWDNVGGPASADGARVLRVSAGTLLSAAAVYAQKQGLSGMEALHGIPGTVGGALVMNAGAYGTEIKDVLLCCEVLTPEGERKKLPAEELALSYRHSVIPEKGYVVLSADFRLLPGAPEEILQKMKEYREKRTEKQPLSKPSAGSTFKRPEGHFAGKLIEDAGLRGYRVGGAAVSEKHCGFVVNEQEATAADIYRLIRDVQRMVYEKSGVQLTPEVKFWGSF